MTGDQYILEILRRYQPIGDPRSVVPGVARVIREWGGTNVVKMAYSGSYAKGTAVRFNSDIDLLISLAPSMPGTLREMYESLFSYLQAKMFSPRRQNVSVRIGYQGVLVDLVPGKLQRGGSEDHSLWRYRARTWSQTNIDKQIKTVISSARQREIKAIKVWRQVHGLEFPSFYLELTVIDALSGRLRGTQPASNVFAALGYIAENLATARVIDPANTNNIVSDDLNDAEKRAVAAKARESVGKRTWEEIIW